MVAMLEVGAAEGLMVLRNPCKPAMIKSHRPQEEDSPESIDELEGDGTRRLLEAKPPLPAVMTAAVEQLLQEAGKRPQGQRDWIYTNTL